MAGLAETTARLKSLRGGAPFSLPAAGRKMVEIGDFGPNPGALRLLSYRPAGLESRCPLVLVLHGCTQSGEAFAHQSGWLQLADRCGFSVIAPEQSPANNPNRCFNWFEPHDTRRGGGEAASIASMVAYAVDARQVDPGQVFIAGLSAGGAMTAAMLASYPELFAGGAVVAGLPNGVANNLAEALAAMQGRGRAPPKVETRAGACTLPRLSIWHGDADLTVSPANASALTDQWLSANALTADGGVTHQHAGWTRTVWRRPGAEDAVLELNIVHGLGHGLPLSTRGDGCVGAAAPFMLEAGISSSMEIARLWGLANPASTEAEPGAAKPSAAGDAKPSLATVGDQIMAAISAHVSPSVRETIDKALRAARLRR